MRGKVTKRAVDALRAQKKDDFLWDSGDSSVPGFGLRITPSGVKSYVFQWKRGGRARRFTIGRHGAPWTPDSARTEAVRLKAEVARGVDPADVRIEENKAPTVAEFAERYFTDYAEPKKKPNSVVQDRRLINSYIVPAFGRRKLIAVTRSDVIRLHVSMKTAPYQANRILALLSRVMTLAELWGVRPDGSNPCRHVERFKESRRERFLSPKELARLGTVIAQAEGDKQEPPYALAALRMLLLSGMRLSEVLKLRWEDTDLDRGVLNLPDSKTGAKKVRLGAPARQLLKGLPVEEDNSYCFPGRKKGTHLIGLPHVWHRLRTKAGLGDVRLHDLRHSFASVAASGGSSLLIIGSLLGHSQPSTTARYAHLSDDPVRAVADATSHTIAAALASKTGNLVKFNKVKRKQAVRQ